MPGPFAIMLVSQINAYPDCYPVAEEGDLEELKRFEALDGLVRELYDREQYEAELYDSTPGSRKYEIVNNPGNGEPGAIYSLVMRPAR